MAAVEPRSRDAPALVTREVVHTGARLPRLAALSAVGVVGLALLAASALRIYEVITTMMVVGDDFRAYWNGAVSVAAGQSPYQWHLEPGAQRVMEYIYPPLLAVLMEPLTRLLDYPAARWSWLALNVICLAASCVLVWRTFGLRWSWPSGLALVSLVALAPSITVALALGQIAPILLLCIVVTYVSLGGRKAGAAGALVAFAAHLKTFPGLLGGYLLLRGQWRAAIAAVISGLLLVLWTILMVGWEPYRVYLTEIVPAQHPKLGVGWNISITGFFSVLLGDHPAIVHLTIGLSTALLLVASAYAIWRAPRTRDGEAAAYALAVVVSLLVSPINGQYNFVILVLPLAVATARVQATWPRHLRWLLLIMLLLVQRYEVCELWPLQDWCNSQFTPGELPWRPGWAHLLIEGPFYGLVALWALLLRLCLERPTAHARQAE